MSSGSEMSINALHVQTGLDRRTLGRLLADVKPVDTVGNSKLYTIKQVVEAARGPSAQAEKARLDKLRADVVELDLAQKRGELIPTETVIDMLVPLISNIRTKLIAIPSKAAPVVMQCRAEFEVQTELKRLINESLEDITNTDAMVILGDNAAKVANAAAQLEGERVGR